MLANNSKRIRELTRGLYSGSEWRVRSFVAEQNRCPGQNIEATKYRAKADQKNDSLLSSSSARSTRIKRKKGKGGREGKGDRERCKRGGTGGGGGKEKKKKKKKKEEKRGKIELSK